MLPSASFLTQKTHLEPMMLAQGGGSTSTQIFTSCKTVSSSFSQSNQSGRYFASANELRFSPSASDVSNTIANSSSINAIICSADPSPSSSAHSAISSVGA